MRPAGFTLIEVMVALAVVAIALPALLVSLYQQVDSTAYLRDKSVAHMVAANKLTELRILARARESLLTGKDAGVTAMADREWFWWVDSQVTEVEKFYRIVVTVAAREEQRQQPLYTLVAFLSADLTSDQEPELAPDEDREPAPGSGADSDSPAESQPGPEADDEDR